MELKKNAFLIVAILVLVGSLVFVTSRQQNNQDTGNDELAAEVAELKAVLGHILERRMGSSFEQVKQEIEAENRVWDLRVDESPSKGNPNAKITVVVFSEFECPFCARVAPMLDSLVAAHPDKIRLVYKHFPLPFHANARPAGAAAIAAERQGKFWEFKTALSPHFRELNEETFIRVAGEVGLDIERFRQDMILDADKNAIFDRDMQLGQEVGVRGTPNFYVNGKRQERFSPALIDQLIAELY